MIFDRLLNHIFLCVFLFCLTCNNAIDDRRILENSLLQGILEIDGKKFSALCNCRPPDTDAQLTPQSIYCNPVKISIIADHGVNGLFPEDIRKVYGQPRDIEMVNVDSRKFSCMDDRITEPSLMTPGGDLGEFLLGLYIFTTLKKDGSQILLTEDKIKEMLERFILSSPVPGRLFSHCNDEKSISQIEKKLNFIGLDIITPPSQYVPMLTESIKKPENHGDIHLRNILNNPSQYHLSKDLAPKIIATFYKTLWDAGSPIQNRLNLDLLSGIRNPSAFLEIDEARTAPLFQPKKSLSGPSAYIIHPTAVNHRRNEMASFILAEIEIQGLKESFGNITEANISQRLDKYGLQWLETTIGLAGKDLKFYKLTFV